MVLTLSIGAVTFLSIATSVVFFPSLRIKKIRISTYWLIALFGALLILLTGSLPLPVLWDELTADSAVNPTKILVLFFSMTILSVYLDEVGLFRYLAKVSVKIAGNNQFLLLAVLYGLASILTVFTSNDVVILTLTPFIVFLCKNTKTNPIPYLVGEFAAANTWSMMLLIGNPTNIYLASSASISFLPYLKVMAIPTIGAGLVELGLLYLLFHKSLKQPVQIEAEEYTIQSKADLVIGVTHLSVCLIFLVLSSYLNIEMWMVALCSALSMLICSILLHIFDHKHWEYVTCSFSRLPYALIPFVLSMFVIVAALKYQGIAEKLGEFLGTFHPIWGYGISSFLSANLVNNIPMAVLFSSLPVNLGPQEYLQAIYASIIGSNIGAFLTPIGALAGIMFSSLLSSYGIKFGFKDFVKYGAVIALPVLAVALGLLSLSLMIP